MSAADELAGSPESSFDIPASLFHQMNESHAMAWTRDEGIINAYDRFELVSLVCIGITDSMEIVRQLRERDLVNSRHLEGLERKVLIEVRGYPQISAIPSRGPGYEIICTEQQINEPAKGITCIPFV